MLLGSQASQQDGCRRYAARNRVPLAAVVMGGLALLLLSWEAPPAAPAPSATPFRAVPTAPPSGALELSVLGDWGLPGEGQARVAEQLGRDAAARAVRAVVALGDSFYPVGLDDSPEARRRFRSGFEAVYLEPFPALRVPWHTVLGNHDYRGLVDVQLRYAARADTAWQMPARWHADDMALPGGRLARFLYLDTDVLACEEPAAARFVPTHYTEEKECRRHARNMRPGARREQLAWLEAQADEAEASDRFATVVLVGHHPMFSNGVHSNSPAVYVPLAAVMARCSKITVYLTGHEHVLQHTTMRLGAPAAGSEALVEQARWAALALAETSVYPRLASPSVRLAGEDGAAPAAEAPLPPPAGDPKEPPARRSHAGGVSASAALAVAEGPASRAPAAKPRTVHQFLVGGGGGVMMYSPPLDNARNFRFVVPHPERPLAAVVDTVYLETCHGFAAVSLTGTHTTVSTVAYNGDVLYRSRVEHRSGVHELLKAVKPGEAPPQLIVKAPHH